MLRDRTIAVLKLKQMRRMPDVVAFAARLGLQLYDLLAYSANSEGAAGRLRLVALFPEHPERGHPAVLCVDGPRESKHRNPPFEDGVFGKSAELCLYYRRDPDERRWLPEHGLYGLFGLARIHLANEYGRWPSVRHARPGASAPPRARAAQWGERRASGGGRRQRSRIGRPLAEWALWTIA